MATELPRTATPETPATLRQLLRRALDSRGLVIGPGAADVLLAHIELETGRGTHIFQHNVGNLVASDSWPGDFWRPPWFQLSENASADLRAKHAAMLEGRAPRAFRAYQSADAGMGDYVELAQRLGLIDAARNGTRSFAQRVVEQFSPFADPEKLEETLGQLVEQMRAERGESTGDASVVPVVVVLGVGLLLWELQR